MENKNWLLAWSILIISPYDDIFSKNWWSVPFVLSFQLVKTGSRLVKTGLDWFYSTLQPEKMKFCICLSILVQTETKIVLIL